MLSRPIILKLDGAMAGRVIPADAESVLEQLPPLLVEDAVVVVDSATGLTNATRTVMVLADRVLPQADRVVAAFATANSGRVHWQGCLKDDHEVLEAIATLPSASIPSMS